MSNRIFSFYKKRWIFFAASLIVMAAGLIGLLVIGMHLDIQFKGGALLKYSYVGEMDTEKAADTVSGLLGRPVTTQLTSDLLTGDKRLVLSVADDKGLDAADQQKVDDALNQAMPGMNIHLAESSVVEPFFGQKFLQNGILALIISSALVVIYVWIRFRRMGGLSAGVMALIALLHDILVVFFSCVLLNIPIGDSFIAVALTIIGYSINDTIVIYDRIRENTHTYKKLPLDQVTDLSINQSFTRSVNTNLAVLISVSCVYILAFGHGIDSIQDFALPMAIGAISGCYSTICIAGPLWVMWNKRKERLLKA